MEQREEEDRAGLQYSFQRYTPSDLTPPIRPQPLKVSPLPNGAMGCEPNTCPLCECVVEGGGLLFKA
jgi:hypothetical protein